jgi:hypothetical protein
MTAWQDLPPQTRRQARMNERGASAASGVGRARNRGENPETKDGTDVSLTPETESPVVDTPIVEAATDGEAVTDSGAAADQVAADVAGAYGRRAQRLTDSDEQPAYRARDYSPEGRRRSFTPQKASESGTPAVQSSAPTVGVPIDLAYFTQAAPVVHSLVVLLLLLLLLMLRLRPGLLTSLDLRRRHPRRMHQLLLLSRPRPEC